MYMASARLKMFCWMAICVQWFGLFQGWAQSTPPNDRCLILHDSSGKNGWVGELHAKMLANLLGHFSLNYRIQPVETYLAGDMGGFATVFYLGTRYNNTLPTAFLEEVMTTKNTVCWFQYNIWKLSGSAGFGAQFTQRFGFQFDYLDSSGYTNVLYKGESFGKNALAPELGRTTILDTNLVRVPATAWKGTTNSIPYILQGSNLWYVADSPFSYMGEEDRYVIFADVLHDILRISHPESHRAHIRLEDISPVYSLADLQGATNVLHAEGVPYSVAVVPVYSDPLGIYNGGLPQQVTLSESPDLVSTLQSLSTNGGQLVMHGYTHQYDSEPNPYTGVSGDDYEFFRVTVNEQGETTTYSPVPEDSVAWAEGRVQAGLDEFRAAGLVPVAFEPPHYAASAVDYGGFARHFGVTIQRALYFAHSGQCGGQFFPYVIERDVYGQKIMPENLGNVDPNRLPDTLIRIARKNLVVRDGWASAFYHPYLGTNYLRELVRGVKALGYTYRPLLEGPRIDRQPQDVTAPEGSTVSFSADLSGTTPFAYQWRMNEDQPAMRPRNATLTLTNISFANAGTYSLSASNAAGVATSRTAELKVTLRVELTSQLEAGHLVISVPSVSGLYVLARDNDQLTDGQLGGASPNDREWRRVALAGPVTNAARFYRVRVE